MPTPPTIVVDDAIPQAAAALSSLGTVIALPAGSIDARAVHDAAILVIRSVTRVDAALVDGSALTLVATATAGSDHIDPDALARRGIAFAAAPGCNAHAVAQYVLAALCEVSARIGRPSPGPVGVVGFGHVGRRVTALLRAYGFDVQACDPPLSRRRLDAGVIDADPRYDAMARQEPLLPYAALLSTSRVLTLHVPRIDAGPDRTVGLVDAAWLDALPFGALLVNTSRGAVVADAALWSWLAAARGLAVLDVFGSEPSIVDAVAAATLITPHIAGYTLDAKFAATAAVVRAVAAHVTGTTPCSPLLALPPPCTRPVPPGDDPVGAVLRAHRRLADDDAALRAVLGLPRSARASAFEALRRDYRLPREHAGVRVPTADAVLAARLAALGFAP